MPIAKAILGNQPNTKPLHKKSHRTRIADTAIGGIVNYIKKSVIPQNDTLAIYNS